MQPSHPRHPNRETPGDASRRQRTLEDARRRSKGAVSTGSLGTALAAACLRAGGSAGPGEDAGEGTERTRNRRRRAGTLLSEALRPGLAVGLAVRRAGCRDRRRRGRGAGTAAFTGHGAACRRRGGQASKVLGKEGSAAACSRSRRPSLTKVRTPSRRRTKPLPGSYWKSLGRGRLGSAPERLPTM